MVVFSVYKNAKDFLEGNWGMWTSWTKCTVTCGEGTQDRKRFCNNPAPFNGGANCIGESSQSQKCDNGNCPDGITF
jgi:hypothetical protein